MANEKCWDKPREERENSVIFCTAIGWVDFQVANEKCWDKPRKEFENSLIFCTVIGWFDFQVANRSAGTSHVRSVRMFQKRNVGTNRGVAVAKEDTGISLSHSDENL